MTLGNLYLCGAGNAEGVRLALTLQAVKPRWTEVILLDDDPDKLGKEVMGVPISGAITLLADADAARDQVVNLVTRKTRGRWVVMEKIEAYGIPFATLVHPSVDVFGTTLAEGVTVYQDVILGAEASLDVGAVALVRSVIGHGASVGKGCVIAPGAVLNARVKLGNRVYFGSNATILPDLHVGDDATVGALTSVLEHVPAKATAIGVPARILRMDDGDQTNDGDPELPAASEVDPQLVQDLIDVWSEVLKVSVKPTDNFFKLGGSSLQVFQVCTRIEERLGLRVSPAQVFRFVTVQALAWQFTPHDEMERDASEASARRERRREYLAAVRRRRGR